MLILSIVGARPEFIQVAPLSRALRERHREILVHTGQHYDYLMSQAFFDELGIPEPDHNLGVGPGSHAQQTAEMLTRLETVMLDSKPDLVIVRGDTNSTLAGALAASKLHIPVAHVEAGERSYDRRMPEEINRLTADHLSVIHFCACRVSAGRLVAEGITDNVHWVGDVMLDAMIRHRPLARERSDALGRLGLAPGDYCLVTIHRAGNTDDPERLSQIVTALNAVPERVVFPVHPRTARALEGLDVRLDGNVETIEPVGYFDMIVLEENARLIATDSGGVQREAYFLGVPCLTLRDETEWVETVSAGWNKLVGADPDAILGAWSGFSPPHDRPNIFGEGDAAERIAAILDRPGSVGAVHSSDTQKESEEILAEEGVS